MKINWLLATSAAVLTMLTPLSAQAFVQKLPIAATMIQLGVPRARIASPVVLKIRR